MIIFRHISQIPEKYVEKTIALEATLLYTKDSELNSTV